MKLVGRLGLVRCCAGTCSQQRCTAAALRTCPLGCSTCCMLPCQTCIDPPPTPSQVYRDAIASPHCTAIHLTVIEKDFECDTTFPAIDPARFRLWSASEPQRTEEGDRWARPSPGGA